MTIPASVIQIEVDASTIILIAMACISIIISLLFDRKTHSLARLSQKPPNVNVFDKTFNVLNPYPESRKAIDSIILLPIGLMLVFAFFAMTFSRIVETGLVLGLVILIISISLLMIDEVMEINATANLFTEALINKADFGKGDVVALHLLKQTMPKLKKYYILLATLFIVSAVTLPYIVQAAVTTFTQAAGSMMTTTSTLGIISPFLSLLMFTIVVTVVFITAGKVKTRVFGLGPSPTLTSVEEQFERITLMAKWGEAPPYELSHRPVVEDAVEERKRKALDPQE